MAIGDIETLSGGKLLLDGLHLSRVIDDPYGLLHAVRGEIIYRLALGDLIDDLVDLGAGAISQEDGAGIGIAAVDMLAAVLFFIGAGQLVLADDIVEIIIDRSAADNTGLGAAVHDLAVNIKAGLFLTNEDAVGDHLMQAVGRSLVDDISIDIGILRQVDLRLIDMEEGIGVAGSHLAGLGRAHNIIGERGDFLRQLRSGAHSPEGSNFSHN